MEPLKRPVRIGFLVPPGNPTVEVETQVAPARARNAGAGDAACVRVTVASGKAGQQGLNFPRNAP